jgi:DNA polymerase epsilon subunit 1
VLFRRRLKDYCRTIYRRGKDPLFDSRNTTICQRETPFYVDTVRMLRDRRSEYKTLLKTQKRNLSAAKDSVDRIKSAEAEMKIVLYDSLQLARSVS